MPSVTHDGRSFMLDGRRLWIVAGTIAYARLPREAWADRIHAAKQSGLNTIETPVFWNRHEPRPGKFDFRGENDLRHFLDLCHKAGMYAILRVGPFVGDGWDMGGIPPWLLTTGKEIKLRTSSGPFLEACSRYFTALIEQVRDLQLTSSGQPGPVVLVQTESQWTCGHETLAHNYLGELNRYMREAGLSCPIINANNLWQSVEGEIECWSGTEQMLGAMRQLSVVRPAQPRLVADFSIGRRVVWGEEPPADDEGFSPTNLQRRLAEVLAGGGQFCVRPFAGGTNMGFWGGRETDGQASFVGASDDRGSLVTEAGTASGCLPMFRRIAHFARSFGRVFANFDPSYRPVTLDPASGGGSNIGRASNRQRGVSPATERVGGDSVLHAVGSQGSVAFVFRPDRAADEKETSRVALLLADGSSLPVTLRGQSVGWCIFDVNVNGRSVVDYCNINAFTTLGRVFVAYGPASAKVMLSVNGSPIDVAVPDGMSPLVIEHEGLTLVIVSEDAIDATYVSDEAVYVGVSGVTADGAPLPLAGVKNFTRIDIEGRVKKLPTVESPRASAAAERVTIGTWSSAPCTEHQDGSSPRFAVISGPSDLATLGSPYGYGWYRVSLKGAPTGKKRLAFPEGSDRLHLFVDGEPAGLVGFGPGAEREAVLSIKKSDKTLVILGENLGRFSGGAHLGEKKGLFGPIWEHEPIRPGKPKIVSGAPIDVLAFRSPLWDVREGDSTLPDRITWSIAHRKKTPLLMWLDSFPARGIILINDEPITYVDRAGPSSVLIEPERVVKGHLTVQIALLADEAAQVDLADANDSVRFSEATDQFPTKSEFAFAKWEPPISTAFAPPQRGTKIHGPVWWKCNFKAGGGHSPLYLEPSGMTKGQVYLNGRHLCRYFVATANGKQVQGQSRYLLPDSWLHHGRDNEIILFDEHGGQPSKCRIVHDDGLGAVIRA